MSPIFGQTDFDSSPHFYENSAAPLSGHRPNTLRNCGFQLWEVSGFTFAGPFLHMTHKRKTGGVRYGDLGDHVTEVPLAMNRSRTASQPFDDHSGCMNRGHILLQQDGAVGAPPLRHFPARWE